VGSSSVGVAIEDLSVSLWLGKSHGGEGEDGDLQRYYFSWNLKASFYSWTYEELHFLMLSPLTQAAPFGTDAD
jgi:hypothetical protein